MNYVALATREYGSGRVCLFTDRIGGYRTGHGSSMPNFWRLILEWTSNKSSNDIIKIGIVESIFTNIENRITQISNVYFEKIDLIEISTNSKKYDLLYFIGLPDLIADNVCSNIETYINNGGGILLETPNRSSENINVLKYIDTIYCSSNQRPKYTTAFWTDYGVNDYIYTKDSSVYFMTTFETSAFSSNWSILMSDETKDKTIEKDDNVTIVQPIGTSKTELSLTYIIGMQNGLVEIEEENSFISSQSYSTSSSSSFSHIPSQWSICNNVIAQWKMNENNSSPYTWDSTGNFANYGTVLKSLSPYSTSNVHTAGKLNGAFNFNGIDEGVSVTNNTLFNFTNGINDTPFALCFWINPTNIDGVKIICGKENVWYLQTRNNTIALSCIGTTGNISIQTDDCIYNNNWYLVVFSFNGTDYNTYVNNQIINNTVFPTSYITMKNDVSNFNLGYDGGLVTPISGQIDNFIILSRAITDFEVLGLWNNGEGTEKCYGTIVIRSTSSNSSSSRSGSDSSFSSTSSIEQNSTSSNSSISSNSSTSSIEQNSTSSNSSISSFSSTSSIEQNSTSSISSYSSTSSDSSDSSISSLSSKSSTSSIEQNSTSSKSSTSSIEQNSTSSNSSSSDDCPDNYFITYPAWSYSQICYSLNGTQRFTLISNGDAKSLIQMTKYKKGTGPDFTFPYSNRYWYAFINDAVNWTHTEYQNSDGSCSLSPINVFSSSYSSVEIILYYSTFYSQWILDFYFGVKVANPNISGYSGFDFATLSTSNCANGNYTISTTTGLTYSGKVFISNLDIYGWGDNTYGLLGNGSISQITTPTEITYDEEKWIKVINNGESSLAIKNGKLYSWGYNSVGQLGLNDRVNRSYPIQIGSSATWTDIANSGTTSLGINGGKLYAWGANDVGQLGQNNSGTGTYKSSPVQIGSDTNWTSISIGSDGHILGINNGKLYTWGNNSYGQLGLGNNGAGTNRSSPVQVGSDTTWTKISAGDYHSMGISNAHLYLWGYNGNYQLSTGDNVDKNTPFNFLPYLSWSDVSAGGGHSLALRLGVVWACGDNSYGQLGFGDTVTKTSMTSLRNAIGISAGYIHSLTIDTNYNLFSFGDNSSYQLGDGTTTPHSSPVQIGSGISWTYCNAGTSSSFGIA